MPITRFLSGFLLLGILCGGAQTRPGPNAGTRRIVNGKYRFSVVRPDKWYVYLGGETPVFFNYGAEKAPADGTIPADGASISTHARAAGRLAGRSALSQWAETVVAARHGFDATERPVAGPEGPGLEVTFDQLPLVVPEYAVRIVLLAWQARNTVYGAELTYNKGDLHAAEYERVLLDLMRSFRLE